MPEKQATQKEMEDARLPLAFRDNCAHLLIPLNKCRVDNFYLPWTCEDEKHAYEKCQYMDYQKRCQQQREMNGFN